MAIAAGIFAQVLEDCFGHIGPFRGAIALTALAMALVTRWDENYGEDKQEGHESTSLYKQFTDGWKLVGNDSKILRIGLIQALSEGGTYTVRQMSFGYSHTPIATDNTYLSLDSFHIVCVHVGSHSFVDESSRGSSHRMCLLRSHDGHHNWRHSISTR